MITILTEKPSAGRNFSKALGGMTGQYNGEKYRIVSARGHLLTFTPPSGQVSESKVSYYKSWRLDAIPWSIDDFAWKKEYIKMNGLREVVNTIKSAFAVSDEVVIATDVDPSGEGELLAVEILQACRWRGKTTRMYFSDESEKSIQKAFTERKVINIAKDGDYIKADARSKWDFLSMQWTRIATCIASEAGYKRVIRQGRLKSVMCYLVGEQEDAIANYKKVPFYEVRFRDENGNTFSVPKDDAVRVLDRSELDLSAYHDSAVVIDSENKKHTAPGKLLDLAGLSAILATKGYKPAAVLSTYQKMYEDQIVSYPRTEDKKITPEQFNELLPLVDKIASLVDVDVALLTHRSIRKSHVDEKAGAHGANRPGPKPPASMAALEEGYGKAAVEIYTILAKNYLAMLAEDYEYIQQKGHVKDYPEFIGMANIPVKMGYKEIFDNSSKSDDDESGESRFGDIASPYIHEGANKKPEKPTMKWLTKRLEKFNVGTGATRTSTLAEITKPDKERGLMNEKKGVLSLTQTGQMSYILLHGCNIASVDVTEKLFSIMEEIGTFKYDPQALLRSIDSLILSDLQIMQKNKETLVARFGKGNEVKDPADKISGTFVPTGEAVSFNRVWGKYTFSDQEVSRLLNGEEIEIVYPVGESTCNIKGVLKEAEWMGKVFWGFCKTASDVPRNKIQGVYMPTGETIMFKNSFGGHEFTADEVAKLLNGETITIKCFGKDGSGYNATGKLGQGEYNGHSYWGFMREINEAEGEERVTATIVPPGKKRSVTVSFKRTWAGHRFTDDELEKLLAGEKITIEYINKAGFPVTATGTLGKKQYKGNKFWTFVVDRGKK